MNKRIGKKSAMRVQKLVVGYSSKEKKKNIYIYIYIYSITDFLFDLSVVIFVCSISFFEKHLCVLYGDFSCTNSTIFGGKLNFVIIYIFLYKIIIQLLPRIQAKGKARQDNQAKKVKTKGKEFLSTYNVLASKHCKSITLKQNGFVEASFAIISIKF